MGINTATILGFVITVLLIPAFVYIWNSNRREVKEMKEALKQHQSDSSMARREMQGEIDDMKVDNAETKTNYVDRFGKLEKQLNREFKEVRKSQSDTFETMFKITSKISVSVAEIATQLKVQGD